MSFLIIHIYDPSEKVEGEVEKDASPFLRCFFVVVVSLSSRRLSSLLSSVILVVPVVVVVVAVIYVIVMNILPFCGRNCYTVYARIPMSYCF